MLKRLIKISHSNIVMLTLKEAPSHLRSDKWSIIEDIVPLLRPFDKLTVELSATLPNYFNYYPIDTK